MACRTGAAELLRGLKANGIEYLFANSGTDFPSIVEAYANLPAREAPTPLIVPHETAGIGMAHGYYLMTGKPQSVMVHVNVGLANSIMGIINAASDNIPVVVMSGRTPVTEHGRLGARATPIQYGQEMFNQSSLVADLVKFHYEMRYPEQAGMLATRATSLAMSEPRGPVYLSLPSEALAEKTEDGLAPPPAGQVAATRSAPEPSSIARAAAWIAQARSPLIICQRTDPAGLDAAALIRLAEAHAIPVVEPFSLRNVVASDHPLFLGYDVKDPLAAADVVIVVDCLVPWIEKHHRPDPAKRIIHIGPDPTFGRLPMRSYQADLAIAGDTALTLDALNAALTCSPDAVARRRKLYTAMSAKRVASADNTALNGQADPMSAEWMSRCLSDIMDDRAVLFTELGVVPGAMRLAGPNRLFTVPHSGGLGWALPAALGAQLADRDRLCIACVGDGSYMFANPVACHQIAEALRLPILIIVKNNGLWNAVRRSVRNMYPAGAASQMNTMPLTSLEPLPDFTLIAKASRAYAERVTNGQDLPGALKRACAAIIEERRAALLELQVQISDLY